MEEPVLGMVRKIVTQQSLYKTLWHTMLFGTEFWGWGIETITRRKLILDCYIRPDLNNYS